jgi:chaperonin GroEL
MSFFPPRIYKFGKEARLSLFRGIELMNRCVSATIGPKGRNNMIDLKMVVQLTKDGVTVAEQVRATDPFEEMGCKIAKEASQNTNLIAGDSTTTAVLLVYEMCKQMLDLPSTANVISVKRGIEKAVAVCVKTLEEISMKISTKEEFSKVAYIASQDETIASVVTDAFLAAGEYGSINIDRSDEPTITFEKTDGMSFKSGWLFPHCCNDPHNLWAVAEDVPILITDKEIKFERQVGPLLNELAKGGMRQLVIIAGDFSGEAKGWLAEISKTYMMSGRQKGFHVICIKAPAYGMSKIALLQDICAVTGSSIISEEAAARKLETTTLQDLGRAKKITVDREKTVLVSSGSVVVNKLVADRIDYLKNQLEAAPEDSIAKDDLRQRLATLTDGIVTIKAGAQTEVERHERKHRIEDATRALHSAYEEGVTPGCGVGLLCCVPAVKGLKLPERDEALGAEILCDSLHSVTLKVLEVAGVKDKEWLVGRMKEEGGWTGYDFKTEKLGDMKELGVWDAKKAVRCALQNAAAAAQTFVSTEVLMSEEDDEAWKPKKG